MWSVVDRNVVMWRITIILIGKLNSFMCNFSYFQVITVQKPSSTSKHPTILLQTPKIHKVKLLLCGEVRKQGSLFYWHQITSPGEMPLYSLKVQTLISRWKHFRSSSSAIFVDDAVLQCVLCVCGQKKTFDQLFSFCGQKGQLQLKLIVKFKQFMALM